MYIVSKIYKSMFNKELKLEVNEYEPHPKHKY